MASWTSVLRCFTFCRSRIESEDENRSQTNLLGCNADDETTPEEKESFVRELMTLLCLTLVVLPLVLYLCLSQSSKLWPLGFSTKGVK